MARIYRDAYGVPHIRATDVLDLARGQGYAAARDRTWQLEYQRRRATGTAAEVLGRPQLAWDTWVRQTRIVDTARRALDALGEESRAFVDRVRRGRQRRPARRLRGPGSRAGSARASSRRPGSRGRRWPSSTPSTCCSRACPPSSGTTAPARCSAPTRRCSRATRRTSRAATPGRSAAPGPRPGSPLIGGDPHRVIESPGVYSQVRLACEDPDDTFDVVGFTFPGVPGVQHFAHAGAVAWAITNAVADYQDVFEESLDDVVDGHEETIAVRGADPVTVEVLATERGPLFEVDRERGRGLSLRNASTVLGDLGFDALLPLLRARTVDDVDRALDAWVEPVNNVVIADRGGTVRFRNAGRVPQRAEANRQGIVAGRDPATAWTGWVDLAAPRRAAGRPGRHRQRTARQRERAARDRVRAAAPRGPDPRAAATTATTSRSTTSRPSTATRSRSPRSRSARCCAARARPDGRAGPPDHPRLGRRDGRRLAWRGRASRRGAPRSPAASAPSRSSRRCSTTRARPGLRALPRARASVSASPSRRWSPRGTPFGIDVRRLATAALDDAADHPATWGETHVLGPTHGFHLADADLEPPELPVTPVSGDIDSVLMHAVAAGDHRRVLPRLGGTLRLGPRGPRRAAAGSCPSGRPATRGHRTTSTSSTPGRRRGCCRSSSTGNGSPLRVVRSRRGVSGGPIG